MSDDKPIVGLPSMSELRKRAFMGGECPVCYSAAGTRAIEFHEQIDTLKAQVGALETQKEDLEREIRNLQDQALTASAEINYLRRDT